MSLVVCKREVSIVVYKQDAGQTSVLVDNRQTPRLVAKQSKTRSQERALL
jgi:hypothetical protein